MKALTVEEGKHNYISADAPNIGIITSKPLESPVNIDINQKIWKTISPPGEV